MSDEPTPPSNRTVFQPSPLQQRREAAGTPSPPADAAAQPPQPPLAPSPAFVPADDIPHPPFPPSPRNPLMARAAPLLALLASVRSGRAGVALPDLHRRAAADIAAFQAAFLGKLADEHLRRAIYALAATADDIALNLPLPEAETAQWAQRSLVAHFFQEAIGGDRFWRLLDEMIARPAEFQDLLELYHACMAAGFEGRYRVIDDGRHAHQALMQSVYQALEVGRSLSQSELAPHWRGEDAKPGKVGLWAPLAVTAAVAAGLLLVIYIGLRLWLAETGAPARAALLSIIPPAPMTRDTPAPPAPVSTQAQRIRTFLKPQIDQGLVTVTDTASGLRIATTGLVAPFDSGSDQIAANWRSLFDIIARAIDGEPGGVRVEGYTDSVPPRGLAFPDNLSLSKARADNVAALIRSRLSDPHRTVTSAGFGESGAVAPNTTAEGRARNRRVEIVLEPRQPMKLLKRVFGNWWVLSILAAVIVALILTLLAPLIIHPMGTIYWRLGLLALVVLVWAVFAAIHVFSARNASDRIAKALEKEKAEGADEGVLVGKRLADAMGRLRREGGKRRDYLYSRPWYVIIGPPGAGKTTALLNSGLRFPFSDSAVKGVGGTRNLDFWFADEAVMVDTAGRYTTQDSAAEEDRKGWLSFLNVLRRNRPLQPINGILVAIGLDTLLTADVAAIDRHADIIRSRLAELREGLEIRAPVYLLFTKSDLVAGFAEFFDDLDIDQRRAVLGHTFAASEPPPDGAGLANAFDEVTEAVAKRTAKRLQDELDARRRGLIVGFPAELAGLRNAVVRLVEGAFPADAREGPARLRGLYFTSGVQQGTPFDRLLAGVASVYEAPAPAAARSGRAYFLNRLLMEVIFGEAGLAEGTPNAKTRRAAILTGGLAVIGVVFVVVLAAWIASFVSNLQFEKDLEKQALVIADEIKPPAFDLQTFSENDRALEDALPVLDQLRKLPRGYDERRRGGPPFPMGLGLYQGDLSQMAEDTYLQALQRIMLPRLILRLENYQRDHIDTPQALYGALKTYLLLGGHKPGGGYEPATVKAWVTGDWAQESLAGPDHDLQRQGLSQHLDAMLADKTLGSVWRGADPLLADVVNTSRNRLATLSPGERAYVELRDNAHGAPWKPIIPADKLTAFANAQELTAITVPYFFTREGYRGAYLVGRSQVAQAMIQDKWVLAQPDEVADPRRMLDEVAQLYANDYIAAWKRVQKAPRAANYFADRAAADAMMGDPSPYKLYLKSIIEQTNMAGLDKPPAGLNLPSIPVLKVVKGLLAPAPGSPDAGAIITSAFSSLASFVNGGKLDAVIKALNDAVAANQDLSQSNGLPPGAAAPAGAAGGDLSKVALGLPEGVGDFVSNIRSSSAGAQGAAALSALRNGYVANLLQPCLQATQGFPFVRGSTTDADMSAVVQLFGAGSGLDQLATSVAPYVDQGSTWRWKADTPADLDPESADRLRQAQAIKSILRPEGLQLKVSAIGWSPGLTTATMRIGDATQTFTPADTAPAAMRWSPSGNGVASMVFPGQPRPYAGEGDWALFHLLENAKVDSMGASAVRVRFGDAATFVVIEIEYPAGVPNPFSGGPWTFRCPGRL